MKNICKYSLLFIFTAFSLNSILKANNKHPLPEKDIVSKFKKINQINQNKSEIIKRFALDSIACNFGTETKFSYDDKGRNTILEYTDYLKIEIIYGDRHVSSEQNFLPDLNNKGEWILYSKVDYKYENDILKEQNISMYDSTKQEWIINEKYTFTVDNDKKLINYTLYKYGKTSETLLPFEKAFFTYDNNDNNTNINTTKYDVLLDKWFNATKTDYFFNSSNLMDSAILYNYISDKPQLSQKTIYSYDSNNKIISIINSSYEPKNKTWFENLKTEYIYDQQANQDILYPISLNINPEHKITTQKVYEKLEKVWLDPHVSNFYYSEKDVISICSTIEDRDKLSVFPNPAKTEINISLGYKAEIIIYDVQAKVVLKDNIVNSKRIDISSLDNGIYFYSIISKEGKVSGKILKQ